jgi:4-amino-4-deoxy-L-arabinose transferase-like glycosyltransferase
VSKLWITIIVIFLFAIVLRLWNFNQAGRWSDEQWYAEKSVALIELIKKGDFSNSFWYKGGSDHPPLSNYIYGLAGYKDLVSYEPLGKSIFPGMSSGKANFNYDLTYMRLVSIIVSSLAVVIVFLIGLRYFSYFVGIVASMILAMLPHFLGLSHFVVLETWIMLFFNACVLSYMLYLETNKNSYLLVTGILTGLNLLVKQSDILIFAFYFFAYFAWKKINSKGKISPKHFFQIGIISLVVCFLLNPVIFFNLPGFISYTYDLWFKESGLTPEMVFGIQMGARPYFYLIAFLVTTPVLIILLAFLGMKVSWMKRKEWISAVLIIWFFVPFLMALFHHRQHMVRYIIQFYAPLSLLAAIGFEYTITKFTKSKILLYSFISPLFVYLIIILYSLSPYYLDYFNGFVGGTKNVYDKQLFYIGWFGEGLRGPGKYIESHASKNAKIGMAIDPNYRTLYQSQNLSYEIFNPEHKYDYVVVNYFNVIRMGFDQSILDRDYRIVYREKADDIDLAWVYKHK